MAITLILKELMTLLRGENVILLNKITKLVPINILIFFFLNYLVGPLPPRQYIAPSMDTEPFEVLNITLNSILYYIIHKLLIMQYLSF